jgi:hypothetical protein
MLSWWNSANPNGLGKRMEEDFVLAKAPASTSSMSGARA